MSDDTELFPLDRLRNITTGPDRERILRSASVRASLALVDSEERPVIAVFVEPRVRRSGGLVPPEVYGGWRRPPVLHALRTDRLLIFPESVWSAATPAAVERAVDPADAETLDDGNYRLVGLRIGPLEFEGSSSSLSDLEETIKRRLKKIRQEEVNRKYEETMAERETPEERRRRLRPQVVPDESRVDVSGRLHRLRITTADGSELAIPVGGSISARGGPHLEALRDRIQPALEAIVEAGEELIHIDAGLRCSVADLSAPRSIPDREQFPPVLVFTSRGVHVLAPRLEEPSDTGYVAMGFGPCDVREREPGSVFDPSRGETWDELRFWPDVVVRGGGPDGSAGLEDLDWAISGWDFTRSVLEVLESDDFRDRPDDHRQWLDATLWGALTGEYELRPDVLASLEREQAEAVARLGSGPPPEPVPIRSPRDAERVAETWLRYWGFDDATMTAVGPDAGIDVDSSRAVAQVKAMVVQIGRPEVQQLYGAAMAEQKIPFFFSLGGFTAQAIEWADRVGVALFSFDLMGVPVPVGTAAMEYPVSA